MKDEWSSAKRYRTVRNKTKRRSAKRYPPIKKSDRGKPWAKEDTVR